MNKKALIVGANGYIGKYLSVFLKTVGIQVIAVDRQPDSDLWFYNHNIYFYKSDIMEPDFIQQIILPNNDIDTIFYLAGDPDIYNNFYNPVNSAITNIVPLIKMLDIIKNNKVNLFFLSSTSVYGGTSNHILGKIEPMTPYAASMIACENFIKTYSFLNFKEELTYTILRIPTIFGGTLGQDILTKWLRDIVNGKTNDITVEFHPNSKKDFFYVKDLCRVIYYLYNQEKKNRLLNLTYGADEIRSWKELSNLVKDVSFSNVSVHLDSRIYDDKIMPINVNSDVNLNLIDIMGLEKGLRETYISLKDPKSEIFNI